MKLIFKNNCFSALFSVLTAGLLLLGPVSVLQAAGFNEGAKKCQECHEAEYDVWQQTPHFKSYKRIHKKDEAKKILEAVGGGKRMKKNNNCVLCHYTMVQKSATAKPKARSGPSCESCHGPSSEWREVHNDYGGPDVKAQDETPDHKQQRLKAASDAGMIWSFMHYDIASNCMTCHGLAHPDLKGDVAAKMLDAGHPLESNFELVAYSQGGVRHRFYPPDVTKNKEMSKAELARLFVVGQAAKLVSASKSMAKTSHAKYQEAQKERVSQARKALGAVKSIAEVKVLLAEPSDANARKLAAAIKDKDLSADVGAMLPSKDSYK